jgi:hypothetical protein
VARFARKPNQQSSEFVSSLVCRGRLAFYVSHFGEKKLAVQDFPKYLPDHKMI